MKTSHPIVSGLLQATLVLSAGAALVGDVRSEETPDPTVAKFSQEAGRYVLKDTGSNALLTMRSQPLLHWNNPARNGEDGAVFLWTHGESPAVIGTCFTYRYNDRTLRKHAFQVLADLPIEARHQGRVVWTPPVDSLQRLPVEGAPMPAGAPAGRSSQMRQLARRFSVKLTQKDGRLESCRLVPQPLYRFEDPRTGASGAIFSFAIGTDPEALLVLSRQGGGGKRSGWHYAFARFTFYPLEGFFKNSSVWKVEKSESLTSNILTRPDYQREPYVTFRPDWLD